MGNFGSISRRAERPPSRPFCFSDGCRSPVLGIFRSVPLAGSPPLPGRRDNLRHEGGDGREHSFVGLERARRY